MSMSLDDAAKIWSLNYQVLLSVIVSVAFSKRLERLTRARQRELTKLLEQILRLPARPLVHSAIA
jgi:hypothetical protein